MSIPIQILAANLDKKRDVVKSHGNIRRGSCCRGEYGDLCSVAMLLLSREQFCFF